ncbi:P-loop NTPase fold protein [Caballeronia sp. HLA56]
MSLQESKQHLIHALGDRENKVIALSGKWGTGKSHLWREAKAERTDEEATRAVYLSLFGVLDMNQLKLKAVQSTLARAHEGGAAAEAVRGAIKGARKVLQGFHKGFAALDDVALLAVPRLLRGRLIVLDDIERKHKNLGVDEVLGFIDEFVQQHDARFLLILNDDQLHERAEWDTLREKVIDLEIRLLTTSEESFEIATSLTPSPYSAAIKHAVSVCGVDNIRVIRRINRIVNRILGDRELDPAVLSRVVPSIVLLSAIHFKGLDDGPDFQFVLKSGASSWEEILGEKKQEPDDESKKKARWRLLLDGLAIISSDEFETLVVQYLESGQFDATAVEAIIDRYAAETETMRARENAYGFLKRLVWDIDLTDPEIVELGKTMIPTASHLDPQTVTDLCTAISEFPGGDKVGHSIVQTWIERFREQAEPVSMDEDAFGRKLHPDIIMEYARTEDRRLAKATLWETVRDIVVKSGWGTREQMILQKATAAEFEHVIRTLPMDERAFFLRQMLRMRIERANYDRHFGSATQHFADACRAIASSTPPGRLGGLITRLFNDAGIGEELIANA